MHVYILLYTACIVVHVRLTHLASYDMDLQPKNYLCPLQPQVHLGRRQHQMVPSLPSKTSWRKS